MLRRILFWGHLIVGSLSGLVLTVTALTGLVLSVCPVLIDWSERTVPAAYAPQSPHVLSVDEAVARVSAAYPGFEPGPVTLSTDPSRPLVVSKARKRGAPSNEPVSPELGKFGVVWVSLSNGHVGPAPGNGFRNADKWLEGVHRWLGVEAKPWKDGVGHVVAACSLLLVFAVGSGLYLWGPVRWWRRQARAKVPRGARGWHETLGFVFSPWLLVLALTAAVMFYSWAGDFLFKGLGKGVDLARFSVPTPTAPLETREAQFRHVLALFPDAETVTLLPPDGRRPGGDSKGAPNAPKGESSPKAAPSGEATKSRESTGREVVASVEQRGSLSPVPTWVRFQSATGALNRVDVWSEMPWRQALRQAAKSVHTGEAFGLVGAVLGVASSLVLLTLCLTGWWLTAKRWKRARSHA